MNIRSSINEAVNRRITPPIIRFTNLDNNSLVDIDVPASPVSNSTAVNNQTSRSEAAAYQRPFVVTVDDTEDDETAANSITQPLLDLDKLHGTHNANNARLSEQQLDQDSYYYYDEDIDWYKEYSRKTKNTGKRKKPSTPNRARSKKFGSISVSFDDLSKIRLTKRNEFKLPTRPPIKVTIEPTESLLSFNQTHLEDIILPCANCMANNNGVMDPSCSVCQQALLSTETATPLPFRKIPSSRLMRDGRGGSVITGPPYHHAPPPCQHRQSYHHHPTHHHHHHRFFSRFYHHHHHHPKTSNYMSSSQPGFYCSNDIECDCEHQPSLKEFGGLSGSLRGSRASGQAAADEIMGSANNLAGGTPSGAEEGASGEPRAAYSYIKSYFASMLQPSDNKLAMKLFGSKKGVLKEKIRQQEVGHWIIHPCSNFRFYWDLVMLILLIANVIVLPVAISFFNDNLNHLGLLIFNLVSDSMFLLDIAVNFRTGVLQNDYVDEIILEPKQIAKHYIRTWFFIDFLSSIPLDYIFLLYRGDGEGGTEKYQLARTGRALKALRLVKLLSLLRLLRLSRLVRYIHQWEEVMFNLETLTLSIFLFSFLYTLSYLSLCTRLLVYW